MEYRRVVQETFGEGVYQVSLQAFITEGKGICAFLSGGESPHNGGVVLAVPNKMDANIYDGSLTADIWSSTVPGHKDTEIATKIAKKLAVETQEVISLTCGIHIDHATKEDIKILCDNCVHVVERWIEVYK